MTANKVSDSRDLSELRSPCGRDIRAPSNNEDSPSLVDQKNHAQFLAWRLLFLGVLALAGNSFASAHQVKREREFAGTINKTIKIRMKLSQDGNEIHGVYYYEKVGKELQLNGSVSGEQVTLKESDQNGNQTGIFKGRFVNADLIEGTWTNTDGTKTFFFSVRAGSSEPRTLASPSSVGGQYKRLNARGKLDYHSAEIDVQLLEDGRVRVQGDATWVGNPDTGNVNTGQIDGTFTLQDNKVIYKDEGGEYACRFTMTFARDFLIVTEDNGNCGGLNVSFDGRYKKFGPPRFEKRD